MQANKLQLRSDDLEPRIMLSAVEIFAAGTTGQEQIELQINGQTVASFSDLGSDAYEGGLRILNYTTADAITAGDVRIAFVNDLYDPANGIDRNVRIDAIAIDGELFEAEASDVFSTGTWTASDGVQPGFRSSEYLHVNGYLQFADPPDSFGPLVRVHAFGVEGGERFELQISGETVATFDTTTEAATYEYRANDTVSADDVRIVFINDQYDPAAGIDSNLVVDRISIDGRVFQTESPDVFSTGTWLPADGVTPGFRQNEMLHTNGYFQYAESQSSGTLIQVNAFGTTGIEQFELQIDGSTVAQFEAATAARTYTYRAEGNVTADRVRVAFVNNQNDPATGADANLFVDNVVIGGTTFETEAADVYSTGTWLPADGIVPGFRRSEVLHANGYFQYAATPIEPGTISLSIDAITIDESAGEFGVVVFRTGGSDGRVTVDYETLPGTADANDFESVSGTLVFEDGISDARVSILINDDNTPEPTESFRFQISNPTGGATLGALTTEVVSISDNDLVGGFLPDMTMVGATLAERLSIDRSEQAGRELLRFSTEVANVGTGPLEIYGGSTSGNNQEVLQRIYGENGSFEDVVAGEFVFHPAHGHIHFEGFASYDLVNDNDQVVASGGKTSFCLVNIRQPFADVTANADRVHGRGGNSCGQIQGISAGYSDVYSASLPDQWIDVTDVADGEYWLRVTADPDNAIIEADEANNVEQIRIRLQNGAVSVVSI